MDEDLRKKIRAIAYYLEKLNDRDKIEKIYAALWHEFKKYSDEVKEFFDKDFDRLTSQDVLLDIGVDDEKVIEDVRDQLRKGILKKN